MILYFQYGDTPLHTSARYGHAGVIRILVSGRCNVSEQNKVRIEREGIVRLIEIIEKSAGNNKYPRTQWPGQSPSCSRGDAGTKFV